MHIVSRRNLYFNSKKQKAWRGKRIMEKLIEKLTLLANRKCWCEDRDFCPCDYSGGNFDDAYWGGHEDGQAQLANEILAALKEINETPPVA
jgi:hypothetical protein